MLLLTWQLQALVLQAAPSPCSHSCKKRAQAGSSEYIPSCQSTKLLNIRPGVMPLPLELEPAWPMAPTFTKCIQLGLLDSLLTCFHRPPCSRTTCLLDIAWIGNLAGQGAVLDAGVHASCIGAYMVALAVVLALHGDTHVS